MDYAPMISSNLSQHDSTMAGISVKIATSHTGQSTFSTHPQSSSEDMYIENRDEFLSNYATPESPFLRMREDSYTPSLTYSYEDSSPHSSASDSPYSIQSDGSRISHFGVPRIRSQSQVTMPQDWPSKFELQSSSYIAKAMAQENSTSERPQKRYPCRFRDSHNCSKTFTTSGHASRHSKIHTIEKGVCCTYTGCQKKFTRADNMKQHLETHTKDILRGWQSLTQSAGVRKAGAAGSRPSSRNTSILNSPPVESFSSSIEPIRIEEDTRYKLATHQQFDALKWAGTYDLKQTQTENNPLCDSQIPSATSNIAIGGKEMMKIQNLISDSPIFRCLVASCPCPSPKFISRKAQIGHYEFFHPALLLRCEFEDCNEPGGAFIAESDRDEHYNSHHRRSSIERPHITETQKDVGEPEQLRRENEPDSIDISHQEKHFSPEYEIKEVIKIKTEDSTLGSEDYQIHGLLSSTPLINTECNPLPNNSPSSTRSTWRDSSADSETDSNCTEDESDLEEDDISSHDPDIIAVVCQQLHVSSAERSEHLFDPIINPLKESLLERIMGDFWTLFNQEWSENIRRRTASPSTPSSSVSRPSSKRSAEKSNKKHKRTGDDNGGRRKDEDENEGPKRPRHAFAGPEDGEDSQQGFSCPYRKHNPRKYSHCDRRWRSCALTPFSTIARVKGHLYRHHRIFQCRRCNEVFKDEDALQSHFMAINPCALQESVPAEGITATLEKQLRNRKKTSSTQSQEERWQDIYRILFPMEIVQGAFFEPVQDEAIQSPASFELSNYEEFSRQELPRVFRGALEAVINTAAQPLEEQLRSQLVSMIQECQDRVFSSYRTRNSSSPAVSRTDLAQPTSFSAPILTSSLRADLGNLSNLPEERPEDILDNMYQRPPYQRQSLSNPDFHDRQQARKPARRDETSESGYVSDFSALNASASTSQDTGLDLTTSNSSSGIHSQSQPTEGGANTNNGNTQFFTSYPEDYGLSPRLSGDFSDMYMYGNHSWEASFLP